MSIFGLGSFAWDRLLENFRLGYFDWELSFGILRLGTFAWDLSLGNFRLGPFALKRSFGNFRLGTFALDPSPKQATLRQPPPTHTWPEPKTTTNFFVSRIVCFKSSSPFALSLLQGRPGTGGTHVPPVPGQTLALSPLPRFAFFSIPPVPPINRLIIVFFWELSLGSLAWEPSFRNFHLGSVSLKLSLRKIRLGTLAWKLSCGDVRLGNFAL